MSDGTKVTKSLRLVISLAYIIGVIAWTLDWWWASGFTLSQAHPGMWIAFLVPIVVLCGNLVLWQSTPTVPTREYLGHEIGEIEQFTVFFIVSLVGLLIFDTVANPAGSPARIASTSFAARALVAAAGVLPFWNMPSEKPGWFLLLKHSKAILLLCSLFLAVASVLATM